MTNMTTSVKERFQGIYDTIDHKIDILGPLHSII